MLDQKEDEHKQRIKKAWQQELEAKRKLEQDKVDEEYCQDLQELCDQQKHKIKVLLDKVYSNVSSKS